MIENDAGSTLPLTKLFAPPVRPDRVPRPRLIDRLNTGLDGKLTLISAPAGFGKTTLVTDWLSQTERPFVWLSCDEDDNDLSRFFTYAAAAVQQIDGVGSSIQGLLQSARPSKTLATAFVNDCMAVASPFLLAFDDYHAITEEPINETIAFYWTICRPTCTWLSPVVRIRSCNRPRPSAWLDPLGIPL